MNLVGTLEGQNKKISQLFLKESGKTNKKLRKPEIF